MRICTLTAALALTICSFAQTSAIRPWKLWGNVWASAFGQWHVVSLTAVPLPGTYTLQISTAAPPVLPDGPQFQPLANNVPLTVDPGPNQETVTPSAVSCSWGQSDCTITVTLTKAHDYTFSLESGTDGLQEAINYEHVSGGMVYVDATWKGMVSEITGASGYSNVAIADQRSGATARYAWAGSSYVPGSIGGVEYADQFPGADPCARIAAAYDALPAAGGIISLTGFGASITCTSALPAFTAPVAIILGYQTLSLVAPLVLDGQGARIEGVGYSTQNPPASRITEAAGFAGAAVIQIGDGSHVVSGASVDHVAVNCDSTRTVDGIDIEPNTLYGSITQVAAISCNNGINLMPHVAPAVSPFDWTVSRSRLVTGNVGMLINGANAIRLVGDEMPNNQQFGIESLGASGVAVIGGDYEGNGTAGIALETSVATGTSGVVISGAYFEAGSRAALDVLIKSVNSGQINKGIDITGCYFAGDSTDANSVSLDNVAGINFAGNHWSGYTATPIHSDGTNVTGTIAANAYADASLIDNTSGFVLTANGVTTPTLSVGGDAAIHHLPVMTWTSYVPASPLTTAANWNLFTPSQGIVIIRITGAFTTAPAGCTTLPVVSVTDGTSTVSATGTNGTWKIDSGPLSQAFSAGDSITLSTSAAAGCTTAPAQPMITVEYEMQ